MKKILIRMITGITLCLMIALPLLGAAAAGEADTLQSKNTQTGWYQSGNHWYYASNGVNQTGWLSWNGNWYYLKSDGAMATGWQKVKGVWYYLQNSGAMKTGWLLYEGKWYYLKGSGAMTTGWQKVNGEWYYLQGNGVMKTGWLKYDGDWYYLKSNGVMARSGMLKIGSDTYFFDRDGEMETGWQKYNGKEYYFYKGSGKMAVNTTIGGYYVGADGAWVPGGNSGSGSSATSGGISEARAKEIALNKTGGGYVVSCHLDWEKGIRVYEIEIRKGRIEYELDIAVSDGRIIKFEIDYDD